VRVTGAGPARGLGPGRPPRFFAGNTREWWHGGSAPLPSDATLEAVENLLPQLCAPGDLFRIMTDSDTQPDGGRAAKRIGECVAEVAKAAEAHAELDAARNAHPEAIARELREHHERLTAEEKRPAADHEKRERAMPAREQRTAQQVAAAEADRQKAAELRADLERRLDMIRSAAG
jgi:hypothetical protein